MAMRPERYRNLNGDSGVTQCHVGPDFIAVQFQEPTVYIYDGARPGRHHVARMKALGGCRPRVGQAPSVVVGDFTVTPCATSSPRILGDVLDRGAATLCMRPYSARRVCFHWESNRARAILSHPVPRCFGRSFSPQ
jgi:hypothetical protein